jgi:bifunctional UDP-N-acetylglucosamine pyrophosphorylase/glucosamine-1-phosphate N-acetyltransferase
VLVLYGDVPLIERPTLRASWTRLGGALALLTQDLDNPRGYGRIVRDARARDAHRRGEGRDRASARSAR